MLLKFDLHQLNQKSNRICVDSVSWAKVTSNENNFCYSTATDRWQKAEPRILHRVGEKLLPEEFPKKRTKILLQPSIFVRVRMCETLSCQKIKK